MLNIKKISFIFLSSTLILNINLLSFAEIIKLSPEEKKSVFNLSEQIPEKNIENTNDKKDPLLAGLYSSLIPGAGMIYLGETGKGLAYSSLLVPMIAPNYITTENYYAKSLKEQIRIFSNELYFYNVYETYQTAIDKIGRPERVLNIKHYSFPEMFWAMLEPRSYISDNILINIAIYGHIILLVLATVITSLKPNSNVSIGKVIVVIPLAFILSSMIAVGEESYFRGFVQPAVSELTNSKMLGNITQATYFGLCHTNLFSGIGGTAFPYGLGTIGAFTSTIDYTKEYKEPNSTLLSSNTNDLQYFLSAGIFGLILGGINTDEKGDGFIKAIAMHALHDTTITTLGYIADGNTGRVYLPIMSLSF